MPAWALYLCMHLCECDAVPQAWPSMGSVFSQALKVPMGALCHGAHDHGRVVVQCHGAGCAFMHVFLYVQGSA